MVGSARSSVVIKSQIIAVKRIETFPVCALATAIYGTSEAKGIETRFKLLTAIFTWCFVDRYVIPHTQHTLLTCHVYMKLIGRDKATITGTSQLGSVDAINSPLFPAGDLPIMRSPGMGEEKGEIQGFLPTGGQRNVSFYLLSPI